MKVVAAPEIFNFVKIGDSTVWELAEEYQRKRKNEFNLTCYQRSFCYHEINNVVIYNGSASRLEPILYPDQIMLMSSHYRDHLVEKLIAKRELIVRDSTTEFLNLRAIRREQATKFARSFNEKAFQMNQNQHTEATAVDYGNFQSRKRAQTSRVLPPNEKLKKS